jgi:hypothetical protein
LYTLDDPKQIINEISDKSVSPLKDSVEAMLADDKEMIQSIDDFRSKIGDEEVDKTTIRIK